jgi:hypothetical protein
MNKNNQPLLLTLTRHTATEELCTMVHPNDIDDIGTLKEMGKKGLRVIVKFQNKTWQVKRANNSQFAKRYDKVKSTAGVWDTHQEGEKWLTPEGRVIVWQTMWD